MNQLVISLIILLIPGLIAALVYDTITQHEKWTNFDFSVAAILFGFFSYLPLYLLNSLCGWFGWSLHFGIFGTLIDLLNGKNVDKSIYLDIIFASVFAIGIAAFASAGVNHKWLSKIAQRLNISNKYGDENLFYYYLNRKGIDWLYIRDFPRKMTYSGRLLTFSENNGLQELSLLDVEVYGLENSESYGHIETIYLCGKAGDFTIESVSVQKRQESKDGKTS